MECLRQLRKMGSIYNQTPSHKQSRTSEQVYAQMGHIKRLEKAKSQATNGAFSHSGLSAAS